MTKKSNSFFIVLVITAMLKSVCGVQEQHSNVASLIASTNELSRKDVEAGILTMNRLLTSDEAKVDRDTFIHMLDSLSEIRPVSTNEYAKELKIATEADMAVQRERRRRPGSLSIVSRYRGQNTIALEKKWRPIFDHNQKCEEFRSRLVETLALSVSEFCKTLSEPECEDLFDAVTKNDVLSDVEKKKILKGVIPMSASVDGQGNTTIRKLDLQHTRNAFE